jgi:hypothetical protein
MWNGNQQQQQQYVSQIPTRLDFSNQIQQQQRLPSRQSSQYSSNNTVPTNNCKIKKNQSNLYTLYLISTIK